MVLGIKEGLVECATVCVKSVVILEEACFGIDKIPDFAEIGRVIQNQPSY